MENLMNIPHLKSGCIIECPACPHRFFTKSDSLLQKQKFVESKLISFIGSIQEIRSVEEPFRWNYRNKVRLHTRWNGLKWEVGIIRKQHLMPIPHCPVETDNIRNVLNKTLQLLPSREVFPLVFYVQSGKQVTLVLKQSLRDFKLNNLESLVEIGNLPEIDGLWLQFNPSAGNKVFLKGGWKHFMGNQYSYDHNGLVYGPASFQQAIPELFNNALDEAAKFMIKGTPIIVDLFTGTGTSLNKWSQFGNCQLIGVESGMESVKMARINNPEVEILLGDCEDRIPQVEKFIKDRYLASDMINLFVNPPRMGLSNKLINWIITGLIPSKIAYLSCSAGTLKRDLNLFAAYGYQVQKIIPYDFLPQTIHVENLALLNRIL